MRYTGKLVRMLFLTAATAICCMAAGCMGPTTRVLVREQEVRPSKGTTEAPESKEEANTFYLWETLTYLAGQSREPGSVGEAMAAGYLEQLLTDYGLETQMMGKTVQAVKKASTTDFDIILLAADYSSQAGSPGANDNASGVAVLLEAARLVSEVSSDTEVRFLCFPGGENGLDAVHTYANGLSSEEKKKTIGVIQLGPLGYVGQKAGFVLGTEDGLTSFLGDQVNESSAWLMGKTLPYITRTGTINSVFLRNRIPAVYLFQGQDAYEQGTRLDQPKIVDMDRLAEIVNILNHTLTELMGRSTPSMVAKSRFYNDLRDSAYVQREEAELPFGKSRYDIEKLTGQTGKTVSQNTTNDGRPMEAYRYPMKWLGVDQIIYTNYYYIDGKLSIVSLDADGAGIDYDDIYERISDVYGEPYAKSDGPDGTEYRWLDVLRRTRIFLIPGSDGYELELREADTQRTMIGQEQGSAAKLSFLIRQIIPEPDMESVTISIYTDGIGKTEHYLESDGTYHNDEAQGHQEDGQGTDSTSPDIFWTLGMDMEDAIGPDGDWRNYTKTVSQLVKLYGQMLSQKEPERYLAAFQERFPEEDDDSLSIEQDMPDFSESFQWFILANGPADTYGAWKDRILFFEDFDELAEYRSQVRKRLGLPEAETVTVGEAPAGI